MISVLLEYAVSKVSFYCSDIDLAITDNLSPERVRCEDAGRYTNVNFTYENNIAVLVGTVTGDFSLTAKVGVCQDGFVGSVCDADWDQEDANVMCKSISSVFGFGFGE